MSNHEPKKQNIGTLSIVAMIYSVIACGAFGIEEMIPECGPGLTIIILAGLALCFALPLALLCAEAGSARPAEGGSLLWVKEFLGEFWFGIMVICQSIWSLLGNAIYIVLAAEYIGQILPMSKSESMILKTSIVLVFFILNIMGIKISSRVENILFASVILAFSVLTIVGFLNWNQDPFDPVFSGVYDSGFAHIGAGIAIGMWMFSGFDELSVLSGEIKDAERKLPKAIMLAVPLIALSNILPTLAGLASVGDWENWTTSLDGTGYVTVMLKYLGPLAADIFVLVAAASTFASFNTVLATDSRCIMIMAEYNFGPAFLAKTNSKGVPYYSLILVSAVTVLLLPFSFTSLVILDVFFTIVVTLLTVAAIFRMKKTLKPDEYGLSINKAHSLLCALVAAVCIFGLLVNGADWYLGGLWWTLSLPLLYVICKKRYGGCSRSEAALYPVDPKTGLGRGDIRKIGYFYLVLGSFAFISGFFLQWYEASWGPGYYAELYGSGLFSDFGAIISGIKYSGVISAAAGGLILLSGRFNIFSKKTGD